MKPRDRVLAAINHEEPDRVPLCIGVSNATGMKMKPYRELKQLLGIDAPDQYIYDWPELGTAAVDEQTMRRLHSDVRAVLDLEPADVLARNHQRAPHTPWIDSWGSGQVELTDDVWFPGVHPMANATTIEEIERYPWPDMNDPSRAWRTYATRRNGCAMPATMPSSPRPGCCSPSSGPMPCRAWTSS